jgi:transaldolase
MESDLVELRSRLLFPEDNAHFREECARARDELETGFRNGGEREKAGIRLLLSEITIDLGSYLPRWRLLSPARGAALGQSEIDAEVEANCAALGRMGAPQEVERVRREISGIQASNFVKMSRMSDAGRLCTRWGNDSAVGLTHALRRGAVLVTTNPVMINDVRKKDARTWEEVRRKTWAAHPGATAGQIASLITMEVVLRNCREMRPIFESTGGKYGYVCLQINPKNCTDDREMADEAEMLYAELRKELKGTPNTSFKVPGTMAGLRTAERLTAKGISVNITASASVSQIVRFAEVIEKGAAPVSFLTMMAGRFEDPVRDELTERGVPGALEASRWAGVMVARRSYEIIAARRGYRKSTLLVASIRGPWAIDGSITDGPSEIVITVFPDKAQIYDGEPREVRARIGEPVPASILEVLNRSEIFRKGYGEEELAPPEFENFSPISATLGQFVANYEEFLEFIKAEG